MNAELRTLFWYTRAELVLLRRRALSFKNDDGNSTIHPIEDVAVRKEVDNIMCGIIQTLDDILQTETFLFNTLFLSHIIQSLSVHLSNLRAVHDASVLQNFQHLPLDINFVRIHCFVETLLFVARANLVSVCTTPPKSNVSGYDNTVPKPNVALSPMYQNRLSKTNLRAAEYNILKKSSSSRLLNVKNNASKSQVTTSPVTKSPEFSNKTDPVLKDTQIFHKDPLVKSRSNRNLSDFFIEDKIYQVNRLSKNISGRDMLNSHHQAIEAMNNSVSDTGAGLPVHDSSSKSTGFHVNNHVEPHTGMRWHRASGLINRLVQLPRSLGR
jgi:hypothetical protein